MVKRAAEHGVVDSYHRFYLKRIDLAFEIVLCAGPLPTSADNPRKYYPEYHYSQNYSPSKNLRYTISVYSPGIHICPMPHRISMGVPLCPSTGSLMLYTVLVSHPVQQSSRHTIGHPRDPVCPYDIQTEWDTRTGYCHYVAGHPMSPRTDGNPIPFMNSRWQYNPHKVRRRLDCCTNNHYYGHIC